MRFPHSMVDRVIRRKAALHKTPLDRYQVRIARTVQEYEDAFRLVHAAYVFQGIEHLRASELRVTKQHFLPEATVLVAYEGPQLVGTMTVILDSPAGLPLDKDYVTELNALRKQGAKVVEYSAFAVVERCWHSGVSNLLYFTANMLSHRLLAATHVAVGVHPKATLFYRAIFNFQTLGGEKRHATLCAPVIALVQDLAATKPFMARYYSEPMATGRQLVEHTFETPLPCSSLPLGMSREMFDHWKMPREVLVALSRQDTAATRNTATSQRRRAFRHASVSTPNVAL